MSEITIDEQISIEILTADRPQVSPDIKAAQKEIFGVAVPTVTVSAVGILDLLLEKSPAHGDHNLLWNAYVCSVSATFTFGLALLLLSLILPRVPRLVPAVKKLVWVAMILLHIAQLILKVGTHSIP
ncbi:hypothetical protein MRB53_020672 [Persea americana]|uniref:Uncharacterized protein n=1 Tax=Persea americana TaxID=3435 RepID=A0ACC2L292_PERAE|nr:hypothetical protein MRB53_020672 [Persea americana]